tara:strand:+ start:523 stop:1161 length:639 start_codon:yes stop_codon:yes gene_type:complete
MVGSPQIVTFSRFTQVSRETIDSLTKYEEILKIWNKDLNLVGKSTIKDIWNRHFLDSFQVIDFIEKNSNSAIDLGSGAGFPGLIVSIAAKERKYPLKVRLIEKSTKKSKFLNEIIQKLELKAEVVTIDVIEKTFQIDDEVIMARAFKPIKNIFELIHNKAKNWKKILIFLGKNGKSELHQASKNWDIEYKQTMSVTSKDSLIIEVNKLKKIN